MQILPLHVRKWNISSGSLTFVCIWYKFKRRGKWYIINPTGSLWFLTMNNNSIQCIFLSKRVLVSLICFFISFSYLKNIWSCIHVRHTMSHLVLLTYTSNLRTTRWWCKCMRYSQPRVWEQRPHLKPGPVIFSLDWISIWIPTLWNMCLLYCQCLNRHIYTVSQSINSLFSASVVQQYTALALPIYTILVVTLLYINERWIFFFQASITIWVRERLWASTHTYIVRYIQFTEHLR